MAVKTAPQPKLVERKTEPARAAEPAKPVTPVKTVEQIMHEKSKAVTAQAGKLVAKKEELFVPKYQLPTPVEVVKPLRLKPVATDEKANTKPVANPIYVAPQREGQAPIKFAPMAIVERAPEKEKKQIQEDSEDMKTSPRLAFKEGDDKKGGVSIEDKLRALYDIQLIDTRIDKMHAMRGELPLEVEDLEAEVEGLETRITNLNNEVKHVDNEIANKKIGIKDSEGLIKKYKEQLNNVKNNREFDSLNKEVEFQELEIVLHNKRIKEFQTQKTTKEELLTTAEAKVKERKNDLKIKKNELNEIIKETEKEEKILRKKGDEARKVIEERLLSAYERIRSGAPNKMAVVPIEREASAGSFIQLPPQKQLDVAARKRVIVDEHSGRILVDAELAREEQEKMDALLDKELRKA
ncbi:MAG: zinc ribbon domain-containing protein [Flavobacteriales bacterium]